MLFNGERHLNIAVINSKKQWPFTLFIAYFCTYDFTAIISTGAIKSMGSMAFHESERGLDKFIL